MNTENVWYALGITVASEASEAVEFALNELDANGTEINNLGKSATATLVVNGYFNKLPEAEIIRATLDEALRIYGFAPDAVQKIDSRRIGNVDWLFEWKKHWKATETGHFIVAPTWEKVENSEKIVVRIEPQMAFGTGTHETTRLCLEAIGKRYESGMSFLDVGTGTGILAIAAAKLNVTSGVPNRQFTAYDTDENSITNAEENAVLNEVGGEIDFRIGSISAAADEHDFVCANIIADIIIKILPLLLEKSKRLLLLSGILKTQQDLIIEELEKFNVRNPQIQVLGEWISLLIEKNEDRKN